MRFSIPVIPRWRQSRRCTDRGGRWTFPIQIATGDAVVAYWQASDSATCRDDTDLARLACRLHPRVFTGVYSIADGSKSMCQRGRIDAEQSSTPGEVT
jgi:hypothetical protein